MSKLRKALNYIGLWLDRSEDNQYQNQDSKYTVKNKAKAMEKLLLHRDFLRSLGAEENVRLTIIESKTTQLVAQTGVVFALLSLFVPMIADKIDGWYLKLPFLSILFFAFFLYLLAIHHAVKNYNVRNFKYSSPSPNNVLDFKDKSKQDFLIEEINDLLHSTKKNAEINNNKASNLIYSANSFKLANILTASLALLICLSLVLTKPKKDSIKFENPIKIENFIPPCYFDAGIPCVVLNTWH